MKLIDEAPVHRPQDNLIPFLENSKSHPGFNLQRLADFRRYDKLSFGAYCDGTF